LDDRAAGLAGIKADVNEGVHRELVADVTAKISGVGESVLEQRHNGYVHEGAAGPAHHGEMNDADHAAGPRQARVGEEAEGSDTTAPGQSHNEEKNRYKAQHDSTYPPIRVELL